MATTSRLVRMDLISGVKRVRLLPAMRVQHSPEGHVGAVFVEGEIAVADHEHVGVVPVTGAAYLERPACSEADPGHAVVGGR